MEFISAIESQVVNWYPLLSETWSQLHPRGLLSSAKPGTQIKGVPEPRTSYIVRRDKGSPDTVINVFKSTGEKVYSIERKSSCSTLWVLYRIPSREQAAIISCGVFSRSVSFSAKPGIQTRFIGKPRWLYFGLPSRRFYLKDGAPYEWSRSTQFLERIINPGGGIEEVRERIALVRLLRRFRFEWELTVDSVFDPEIALASAFVSMLTAWTTNQAVVPGVRTL